MSIYRLKWAQGCDGPEIPEGSLRSIKVRLDEIYGFDVGHIEVGFGGPEGAQAPEWEIEEVD